MREPGRKFPVVLDPTIILQPNAVTSRDTLASSYYPSTAYYNLPYLIAGSDPTYGITRSFLWFKLPALPSGAKIESAKFSLYMYGDFADTTDVELRSVQSDWESATLTWNNQPSVAATASSSTPITGRAWYDLTATQLVQDWYNAVQRDYGIELRASPGTANRRSFESGDYTADPTLTPKLSITYTVDPVGDQPFWTYVGGVNPFNGNLMAKAVDLATPGRGSPVTVTRTYNSRATEQAGLFGHGWSSNLEMHIAHTGWAPPVFWDATGTRHTFQDNDDGTFSPPPGIHYGLKWDSPTSTYQITTLNNTVYTFDSSGRLIKITDPNNQITAFNRDGSGKLTSITDASGRQTTVAYNASGFVSTITDPAGRSAIYQYDAGGNLTSVEIKQGTSSVTTQYEYAAGTHRLTVVRDPKSQPTTITYDTSTNRVSHIDWTADGSSYTTYAYGVNASQQKTGTVSGPLGRSTTYTFNDTGNLLKSEVSNGGSTLTTTYTWDTANHLLSVTDPNNHTTSVGYNDDGQPVMATDANERSASLNYDTRSNLVAAKDPLGNVSAGGFDGKNNQTAQMDALGNASFMTYDPITGNLLSSTKPISLADNLITNPGFEDALAGSWETPSGITVDTSTKSGGYQSLKIVSPSASGLASRSTIYAPVTPGAYYTLAADTLTGSGSQVDLRIYWYDSNKVLLGDTGNLSVTTNNLVWRRKGTHVDAPANASYAKVELAVIGIGTAWFDNVQLETGAGRSGNNTLVNPSFDYDLDQTGLADFWYPPSPNPGGISIDFSTAHTGPASEKLVGQAGVDVYVGERVDIAGDSSTKLAFSGWAKASGGTAGRPFEMELYLKNANGETTEIFTVPFDPTNSGWHQAATEVKATMPFAYVKVYADYNNQTGTAWFDDFEVHTVNPTSSAVSAFNYVENSSLEADNNATTWPDGWEKSWQAGTSATFGWEGLANAYSGDHSVGIANPGGWASVTSTRRVPYDPNKIYTAVGYAKTVGVTSSAHLLIHAYNSANAWLGQLSSGTLTGTTDWSNLSVVLNGNAPAETAYIRVGVQMTQGSGTAYFDNIRLLVGEQRTTLGYDTAGNYVTSVKDPLGNTVAMTVDVNTGNVTSVAKPLGSALTYSYDWLNRLTGTTYTYQSANKTFAFAYDLNSNLTSVTDPNGTVPWSFTYNALDQLTSASEMVSGAVRTTSITYDTLGNLTKVTSPNAAYAQMTYDGANRVTKIEYGTGANPPSDTFDYEYDAAGNLTSFGPSGSTTTLACDPLDRLTSLTKPFSDGNHSLTYAYDDGGRQTSVSVAAPYLSWSADYEYDSRSLVSQVTENRFAKKSWYLQNEAGQTVKSYSEANSGGFSSFCKYNAGGLLTEVLIQNSSGQATTLLRYTYNQNGNVTRVDDDMAGRWVLYTYDELDQLTQEEYWTAGNGSPDTMIQYGYDALGNRTSVTRDGVTTTYSYNAEKNRLTAVGGVSYQYDSAGNLTSDGANTYTWDNANRLKQVQAGANTYSFTYDALGRRVSKTVNGTTEYYHYDGDKVAYVTNASGLILRIFTYDGSGRPIYLHQNGTLYQYHYNGHGDVIKLTDMNQAVVAEYKYDAWGNITSKTGSLADSNPYRYAGYWYDKSSRGGCPPLSQNRACGPTHTAPPVAAVNSGPVCAD